MDFIQSVSWLISMFDLDRTSIFPCSLPHVFFFVPSSTVFFSYVLYLGLNQLPIKIVFSRWARTSDHLVSQRLFFIWSTLVDKLQKVLWSIFFLCYLYFGCELGFVWMCICLTLSDFARLCVCVCVWININSIHFRAKYCCDDSTLIFYLCVFIFTFYSSHFIINLPYSLF